MSHLNNINNDYLRYTNCWEDADLLLDALQINQGDRVLSIGSAGDNCFSLLCEAPDLVVAVDVNQAQLALIELKKAAIKHLDHSSFLELLGFSPSKRRDALFQLIMPELSPKTRMFWQDNTELIEQGLIHQGKFEKYFELYRNKVLPLIHSSNVIDTLFESKSSSSQKGFYSRKWNNLRWRGLFKIFFSKFIMGRLGRDPQFLTEVELPVGDFIYNQAANHLSSKSCQQNFFLDYILRGSFNIRLPHYAREENFYKIKSNIDKLEIRLGYAQEIAEEYKGLNKFNLSNIFEYMSKEVFQSVVTKLASLTKKESRFAYWNLMVPRELSSAVNSLEKVNFNYTNDNGFFYSSFNLNIKL